MSPVVVRPPVIVQTWGSERRLRRRADFLRVQAQGERASSPHFVLLVAATSGPPDRTRFGIVVTKKVGNAVQRNRIKRVCRECLRAWAELVPEGIDLVVIARSGASELGLAAVRAEWQRAQPALLKRCAAVLAGPKRQDPAGPDR